MVFKNQKELEAFLMKKCQSALSKAQNRVYEIIKKFLDQFYADYDPREGGKIGYDRTYQLLNSLVKQRIVPDGKGYKAEIYFDLDSLKYSKYIWQGGNVPTGEQVFEAAKQGLHGAIGDAGGGYQFHYVDGHKGISIWNDPIQELDAKAIDILVDMLRAEGISIKKG